MIAQLSSDSPALLHGERRGSDHVVSNEADERVFVQPSHRSRGFRPVHRAVVARVYSTVGEAPDTVLGFHFAGNDTHQRSLGAEVVVTIRNLPVPFRAYEIGVESPSAVSQGVSRVYRDRKAVHTSDAQIALSDDGRTTEFRSSA